MDYSGLEGAWGHRLCSDDMYRDLEKLPLVRTRTVVRGNVR